MLSKYCISLWLDFLLRLVFKPQLNFSLPIHPRRKDLYDAVDTLNKSSRTLSSYYFLVALFSIPIFVGTGRFFNSIESQSNIYLDSLFISIIFLVELLILVALLIVIIIKSNNAERKTIQIESDRINQFFSNNEIQPESKIEFHVAQLINQNSNKQYPDTFVILEWVLFIAFMFGLIVELLIPDKQGSAFAGYISSLSFWLLIQVSIGLNVYNQQIKSARLKIALSLIQQLNWHNDESPIKWSAQWIYTSQSLVPEWLVKDDDVMMKQFVDWLYKTPLGKQNQAVFQDEDKWPTPYWLYRNIEKYANGRQFFSFIVILFCGVVINLYIVIFGVFISQIKNLNLDEMIIVAIVLLGACIGILSSLNFYRNAYKKIMYSFKTLFRESNSGFEFLNNYYFGPEGFKSISGLKLNQNLGRDLIISIVLVIIFGILLSMIDMWFQYPIFQSNQLFSNLLIAAAILLLFISSYLIVYNTIIVLIGMSILSLEKFVTAKSAIEILSMMGWDQAEYRISTPRKFVKNNH